MNPVTINVNSPKMWIKFLLGALMSAVIVAVFFSPSPMSADMALVDNAVTIQPEMVYRIMYFHVPQAITATVAFLVAMFFALRYLSTKNPAHDIKSYRANHAGLVFAILALVTGMVFARYTWGFWWDWSEVRMTSMFILALMYGGYFSLRSAIIDEQKRATLASVMSVLFGIAGIFLMFVVPRISASRHPSDSIVNSSGQVTMGPQVRLIFFSSVVAFLLLFYWIWNLTTRLSIFELRSEQKRDA